MALGGGDHVFGAVVNHFYRLAGFPGQQRGVAGDHRRIFFLAAEAAAGFRLDDADFVGGQIEKRNQRLVNVIRALQRAPDGDAFVRDSRDGDHALGSM